jgi:hypothetical protein
MLQRFLLAVITNAHSIEPPLDQPAEGKKKKRGVYF